mmetsp:Transcript_81989/g.171615  ORF Transcript_81989/g.171615 Transcript_81989/m.171615 type:complete len:287 (-) Transcript_81989:330-1190(-)|eukprot:CAMPEP_0206451804 /NCGR_PEP_ID=MMETSP0324_2-20121206/19567_1 /ASSEMBLY_ACC=CAM_ASM_000836 /TAXON_ID=2866 /ORGANISM="Crypthecodinium cohnii, Strain Seligo" /LENGTH=286 /DNA_ID=CAMNT_0053921771 /DNA_START=32 /DNA_END=892 /DNA_ORIENTATION=-
MDVQIEEEILSKSGPELFRELRRLYALAEVEDYCKAGQWKDELMRIDIHLFSQHTREAGADDPPPLEEVKVPECSKVAPGGIVLPMGRTNLPTVKPPVHGREGDLRAYASLASKFNLDPAKTKECLDRLQPERRRHVLQSFQTNAATKEEAMAALLSFIATCEQTGYWGSTLAPPNLSGMSMPAVRPPAAITPASVWTPVAPGTAPGVMEPRGVKRPIEVPPPAFMQSAKTQSLAAAALSPKTAMPPLRPQWSPTAKQQGWQPTVVAPKSGGLILAPAAPKSAAAA